MTLDRWRDAWEALTLDDTGIGLDVAWPFAVAVSGSRVVIAGATVGTGGGGDRDVVWVGDAEPASAP